MSARSVGPSIIKRHAIPPALVTASVHLAVAVVAATVVLVPAPRWFVLYEITGTPLPVPSRLAWDLSIWLRRLSPLLALMAPVGFVADAFVAVKLFGRSSRKAGWLWFWGVLVFEVVSALLWIGALFLPRLNL
jgi:hypothetical protein